MRLEDMSRIMVSFRLKNFCIDMLEQLASKHDCSKTDIVNALIRYEYYKEFCNYSCDFDKFLEMVK